MNNTFTRVAYTADSIRNAALDYNSAHPEAAEDIATGTPTVRVIVRSVDNFTVRVHIFPGVVAPDGGFIGSADPTTYGPMKMFTVPGRPRERNPLLNGNWVAGKTVQASEDVTVTIGLK